jgi:hypothetical protein
VAGRVPAAPRPVVRKPSCFQVLYCQLPIDCLRCPAVPSTIAHMSQLLRFLVSYVSMAYIKECLRNTNNVPDRGAKPFWGFRPFDFCFLSSPLFATDGRKPVTYHSSQLVGPIRQVPSGTSIRCGAHF